MLLAFALAKNERYPQIPAGLDFELAWWVFLVLVALVVWSWSRAPWLRRALLGREDPRIFALMRVMLALFTFACFWNLEPYWRMLWSDEGMFTLEEAQRRYGRSALSGWTELDGFLDPWAVVKFLWETPSLLILHGEPAYVRGLMFTFFGLLGCYLVGFRTRTTGVLCWLLLNGIYQRNSVYHEGTDTVFRVVWFYMLFARTDAAWSVDNALRRWREGRAHARPSRFDLGLFADRLLSYAWIGSWLVIGARQLDMHLDAPVLLAVVAVVAAAAEALLRPGFRAAHRAAWEAEHGEPLPAPPRFEWVPRWPRLLVVVQFCWLYCNTGALKTGGVWTRGDALYYALNLDHFYRLEGFTQWLSAYAGTNFFRLATWLTHAWEIGFPLVAVGLWFGYRERHRAAGWARVAATGPRAWTGHVALVVLWATVGWILYESLPLLYALNKQGKPTMPKYAQLQLALAWYLGWPLLVAVLAALGRWTPTIPGWRRGRLRMPPVTLSPEFLRRWLLGRRLWLTLGVAFHGFLIVFMNIGMFPFIMLGSYLCFMSARPWIALAEHVSLPRRLSKWPELAGAFAPVEAVESVERRASMRRGGEWIHDRWLLLGASVVVATIAARGRPPAWFAALGGADTASPPSVPRPEGADASVGQLARATGNAAVHTAPVDTVLAWPIALACLAGVACLVMWLRTRRLDPDRAGRFATAMVFCASTAAIVFGIGQHPGASELAEGAYRDMLGRLIHFELFVFALACLIVGWRRRRRPTDTEHVGGWPLGRALALSLCLWHVGALSMALAPNYPVWSTWHGPARRIFGSWLRVTNTNQSWKMFAPNPPRANVSMQTVVVDGDGKYWDLNNNAVRFRPRLFWANDRMRKMQRRMVGSSKWYLRYWANFYCAEWTLDHGTPPKEIQIYKVTSRIPAPNDTKWKPWDPRRRKLTTTYVDRIDCPDDPVPVFIKQRRGLPLSDADHEALEKARERAERDANNRIRAWERRSDFGGDAPPPSGGFVPKGTPVETKPTARAPRPGSPP